MCNFGQNEKGIEFNMEELRLQKYMADCGIASRRKCEELILQGNVSVNDKVVTQLGIKIDPQKDKVSFKGKLLTIKEKKVYILLNKPIGYVTTAKDQFDRDTVIDLINIKERIVPAGRLDMYTSGALLLSNDGDFVYKVTHPKHEIEKTYNVTLKGIINSEDIKKLSKGVEIDNLGNLYTTLPSKVRVLKIDKKNNLSRIEIKIHEGKNRQVRKMCKAIDKKVLALHRSKIDFLSVANLKLGEWRYLSENEVKRIEKFS